VLNRFATLTVCANFLMMFVLLPKLFVKPSILASKSGEEHYYRRRQEHQTPTKAWRQQEVA
jgi:hypothetical protein